MGSLRSLRSREQAEPVSAPIPTDDELIDAVLRQTGNVVQNLLKQGANPNAACTIRNALSYAVMHGKLDIAKRLLDFGADVNQRNNDGSTPLMWAGFPKGNPRQISEFLLNRGADIDAVNRDGCTALMIALHYYHFPKAELLVERGADIRIRNRLGKTAYDLIKHVKLPETLILIQLLEVTD